MAWFMWFIALALLLYSWAVWGAHIERELCWLFVWVFMAGFVCDLVGTAPMILRTNGFSAHAVFGVAALVVMGLHGYWAYVVLRQTDANRQRIARDQSPTAASRLFRRWSPWAYALWIITLVSGGLLHWLKVVM